MAQIYFHKEQLSICCLVVNWHCCELHQGICMKYLYRMSWHTSQFHWEHWFGNQRSMRRGGTKGRSSLYSARGEQQMTNVRQVCDALCTDV